MGERAALVRSNYLPGAYTVQGQTVVVEQLKIRTMNFGQHWRGEGVQSLPFEIELPIKFGIDIIEWQLPSYIEDSKQYPDLEDLMEGLLRHEGWPEDGSYLLREGPEVLRQLLLEYFAHEMLLQWFGDGDLQAHGFVLNTCDEVYISGDHILISGQCRASGTSSAYQDH